MTVDKYDGMLEHGCYESLTALRTSIPRWLLDARKWEWPINGPSYRWDSTDRWQFGQCPIFALALYDELSDEGWELCVDGDDFGLHHAFVVSPDRQLRGDSNGCTQEHWSAGAGFRYGEEALEYLRDPSLEDGALFPQVYDEETRTRVFEIAQECREEVSH